MTALDLVDGLMIVVVSSFAGWLIGQVIVFCTPLGAWLTERSMKRVLQREARRRGDSL